MKTKIFLAIFMALTLCLTMSSQELVITGELNGVNYHSYNKTNEVWDINSEESLSENFLMEQKGKYLTITKGFYHDEMKIKLEVLKDYLDTSCTIELLCEDFYGNTVSIQLCKDVLYFIYIKKDVLVSVSYYSPNWKIYRWDS